MISLQPVTARARSMLFGKRDLISLAEKQVELHPASTIVSLPAIALHDEWDRVTKVYSGSDPAWERANMEGGERVHPPTTAYLVRDVLIAGQTIYRSGAYMSMATKREFPIVRGVASRFKRLQLCSDWVSLKYFGHWIQDSLPLELLAAERDIPPIILSTGEWMHELGYRSAARLPRATTALAHVEELWIVDDRAQNRGRVARMGELRRRLRRPNGGGPKRVFLDRGSTGVARPLINREMLATTLHQAGFVEVHPEKETADSLARLLSDADICASVEGSGIAHANMLMPAGAKLLILAPPQRFSSMMKVYADSAGLRTGYVVGDYADHPSGQGFSIPLDRMSAVLDMLDRAH